MSRLYTLSLVVKDEVSNFTMDELLRLVLIDQDWTALDKLNNLIEVFGPGPQDWSPTQLINYAAYISSIDESGDATFERFIEEDPAVANASAFKFAERFLIWAQGTDWKDQPEARKWFQDRY